MFLPAGLKKNMKKDIEKYVYWPSIHIHGKEY
jgi:hypothetical protein